MKLNQYFNNKILNIIYKKYVVITLRNMQGSL